MFLSIGKLAGKFIEEKVTLYEIDKCKKDTIVFDGDDRVTNALDFCLKLKGEERKDKKNGIIEYNLQIHAHNGRGFDDWILLKNIPCDK